MYCNDHTPADFQVDSRLSFLISEPLSQTVISYSQKRYQFHAQRFTLLVHPIYLWFRLCIFLKNQYWQLFIYASFPRTILSQLDSMTLSSLLNFSKHSPFFLALLPFFNFYNFLHTSEKSWTTLKRFRSAIEEFSNICMDTSKFLPTLQSDPNCGCSDVNSAAALTIMI